LQTAKARSKRQEEIENGKTHWAAGELKLAASTLDIHLS
jgi:hypothetical protein